MGYRVNYSKVISQASSITDNANSLSVQINLLTAMEQDFRIAWKGQAADVFMSKLVALRDNMNRTKQQISNLASTIKFCADRIQREDEEAERRAVALKQSNK